jgi:hypothetical protein
MLLTYGDVADVPHKLSTFYAQAFDSLFHRHDAWKGGFQRERRTDLDTHDFARAFAAFSLVTYDRRELSFTRSAALAAVDEAKNVSMQSFDGAAFLDDATQAVCLLIEDGLELRYAHRSFQEYFVARFIQAAPHDSKVALLERYLGRLGSDEVVSLLFELDPLLVEKHFVLPHLRTLKFELGIENQATGEHLLKYLQRKFSSIGAELHVDGLIELGATIKDKRLWEFERFVYERYEVLRSAMRMPDDEGTDGSLGVFLREYDEGVHVPTSALDANSAVVRTIADGSGTWSLAFLRALCSLEEEVSERVASSQESLKGGCSEFCV